MTKEEVKAKIDKKIQLVSKFKIGKSGQSADERFRQNYEDEFRFIDEICFHENESSIDELEEYLIAHFKNDSRCQNEQVGGGEMTKSNKYIIYLVWS